MTQTQTTSTLEQKRKARKIAKKAGRDKRKMKLKTDAEFTKAFFEARSKRASDKKSAFRKKKKGKKA